SRASPRRAKRTRLQTGTNQSRSATARSLRSSLPGLTPQVGFTRLAADNSAQLGQARVAVQSIQLRKDFLAKKMDARVISAFTRVFDALLPAHDGQCLGASHSNALLEYPRFASAFTNSVLSSNCISLAIVSSAEACSPAR